MNFGTAEILLIFFVLLVPIVIIAIVVAVVFSLIKKPAQWNMKKCPFCAEMVKAEAMVCRYCGRDI